MKAGIYHRDTFYAVLKEVDVEGVDAEEVEQVSPELLVVTRLGRGPVFRLHWV